MLIAIEIFLTIEIIFDSIIIIKTLICVLFFMEYNYMLNYIDHSRSHMRMHIEILTKCKDIDN